MFVRGVMYGLGYTGRELMQQVARNKFILRNNYTTGHMIYHVPRAYNIEDMEVGVGHVKPYLSYHERGDAVPARKRVTFIPKPPARVAYDHRRLVRNIYWKENVKFDKEGVAVPFRGRIFIRLGNTIQEIPRDDPNDNEFRLIYVLAGKYVDVPATGWLSLSLYRVLAPGNFNKVVSDSAARLRKKYNIRT